MEIKPQRGPQTKFLETSADIAIFGGAAGGGKSFALLLDPLRHVNNCPEGGAAIFRRTSKQAKNEGSIWDEAQKLYTPLNVKIRESPSSDIIFPHPMTGKPHGFRVRFNHMQHEKDRFNFQGAQIPVILFDELTHFTRNQFFYLVGRNRSTCGIKPYVRGTCNPDKNSWVREFIDWWIGDDGYAIPERSGKIRWLVVVNDKDHWFDRKGDAKKAFPEIDPTSVTFILSRLKDNKILMEKDPGYKARLMSLNKVDRERLLGDEEKGGNWDIMPTAGMFFKRHYFEEVPFCPPLERVVRCWDRAATEWNEGDPENKKPDATAGVKIGKTKDGRFIILDVEHERYSAGKVENLIKNVAQQDGVGVTVKGFQDPGSAGKGEIENFIKMLAGFDVKVEKISVDKQTAAKPLSSQAEFGNILMLASCKNKDKFYSELENFPDDKHDDIVDATSGAFNELNSGNTGEFTSKFNRDTIKIDTPIQDKW